MASQFQHFKALVVATVVAAVAGFAVTLWNRREITWIGVRGFVWFRLFLVEVIIATVAGFFVLPFRAWYAKSEKIDCSSGNGGR